MRSRCPQEVDSGKRQRDVHRIRDLHIQVDNEIFDRSERMSIGTGV